MQRAPQVQEAQHQQRHAQGFLAVGVREQIGHDAHELRAEAEADDVQDEQHDARRQRPHAQAHQPLDQREGRRQVEAAEERGDDVQAQGPPQIVHQEDGGEERHVAALAGGDHPGAPALVAARQRVRQTSGGEGAEAADHAREQGERDAHLRRTQAVGADQEGRHPQHEAVADEAGQCRADGGMPDRPDPPHVRPHLAERRRALAGHWRPGVRCAALGLDGGQVEQGGDGEPGNADGHEGHAPADVVHQPAAAQIGDQQAEVHAEGEDAHGGAPGLRGKQVRDDGV